MDTIISLLAAWGIIGLIAFIIVFVLALVFIIKVWRDW
jgi:hypothetical protein